MPNLATILECTGCASCANSCRHNAIHMKEQEGGFLYPFVDESKCVGCGLCEKRCPVLVKNVNDNWELPKAYAVWNKLDRSRSSSGGAFSSFARKTLQKGGVVFGAAFDNDFNCCHIEVRTLDGLEALRGSKYVQSNLNYTFTSVRQLLKQNIEVLFSGTPCQVAGLKCFLERDYRNLITLDLACHGVPSNACFHAYLEKISTRFAGLGMIDGFEFRRRYGWGKAPSVSLSGKFRSLHGVENIYMEAFDKSAIFRMCCYQCQHAKPQRIGDCSLADFWGIGKYGIPFSYNTSKGVSLVLANNAKGEKLVKELEESFIEERSLDEALIENHNLHSSSVLPPNRSAIIAAFLDKDCSLNEIDKKYHLINRNLKSWIKLIGLKMHIYDQVKFAYDFLKTHTAKNTIKESRT